MKPNLIINGVAGRMGRRILTLALEEGYFNISACVDRPEHPDLGKDVGALAGAGHVGVHVLQVLGGLQGDPAAVEGYRLAHETKRLCTAQERGEAEEEQEPPPLADAHAGNQPPEH